MLQTILLLQALFCMLQVCTDLLLPPVFWMRVRMPRVLVRPRALHIIDLVKANAIRVILKKRADVFYLLEADKKD